MFYYENRGKCVRKLWKHEGKKLKVYLHAEESWAETASHSHWLVKSSWWRPKRLLIEEVMGTKRRHGQAKMIDNGEGVLWIRGSFKGDNLPNPYFKLTLTSDVSREDFQLGYSMSGMLERSCQKYISFQTTHLAFVRRKDQQNNNNNNKMPSVDADNHHNNNKKSSRAALMVKNLCRLYLSSK